MARQLVGGPEGDGEAVLHLFGGFANPLRLAAYSAASHLPRPAGRWRNAGGMVSRPLQRPDSAEIGKHCLDELIETLAAL